MALPPKGDPQRPLHLAVRSTRILGLAFILLNMCGMLGVVLGSARQPAAFSVVAVSVVAVYLVPGVLYLLCASFIKRRHVWAVILGLVIVSIHSLITLFLAATLMFSVTMGASTMPAVAVAIIGSIMLLFLLAFGQLIYHLSKSFAAIRIGSMGGVQGFPISMTPTPPGIPQATIVDSNWGGNRSDG